MDLLPGTWLADPGYVSTIALARYHPDGRLDSGFAAGGTVTTAFGGGDSEARAVAAQEDGKIVAAGSSDNPTFPQFALARYLP